MEILNYKMEFLFDNKHKYKDQDYIVMMNQLKIEFDLINKDQQSCSFARQDQIILHINVLDLSDEEEEEIDYDSDGNENYISCY